MYIILLMLGLFTSRHIQFMISIALIYALVSIGLVIIMGYGGLVSFGQGAFYAIGAYSVGLLVKHVGIYSAEILLLAGITISTLVAAGIGALCSRTRRLAFAMITLAFTMIIYVILLKFYAFTGGTDGLRIPIVKFFGVIPVRGKDFIISNEYFLITTIFILAIFLTDVVINSPLSLTLRILRDAEIRAISIGVSPFKAYTIAFTYSGFLAGLAGVLYAFLNAHIDPTLAYWTTSGEFVFISILGGLSSVSGVVLASIIYVFMKFYLIAYTAYYWQFAIGILLLFMALMFPRGLSIIPDKIYRAIFKLK
ncbi:MAG: branched-chain amino acid ABC transporter permease [Thermoprotei archaeon]